MYTTLIKSSHQARLILFAAVIVVVTACSLKSMYNRLDYIIPSYVEGIVTLDDVLEDKVEQRAQLLVSWHRNTQLKQYAQLLRTFQLDTGPQLTEERVLQHMASMEIFWDSLSLKLNQEMAELLPLLDEQQQQELFDSITEKNEGFRDEYVDLDDEERIEAYTENMLDTYEKWLGSVTEDQQRAIELSAARLRYSADLRLKQRKLWQDGIQDILKSTDDTRKKSEKLHEFFTRFSIEDAELSAATEINKRVIAQLTVQIIHGLTVQQKEYFIGRTDEYIRVFTELAENR